jgi:osmotically-inducible protein OsmY
MQQRYTGRLAGFAVILVLISAFAACKGKDESNANTNANANHSAANTAPSTPTTPTANPQTSEDNAIKNAVMANLTKAGLTTVTVSVTNGVVTLGGTAPAAKLQDAVKAANDATPKPKQVLNQISKT